MDCRTALLTLLDQVDYTSGNCRPNEMVGAVLPAEVIRLCREAAQPTLAPDGAKSAATLSGLYNCYVCGEEKCTEEQKLYLCKDCANGIVEEVVELIQDDRPAGKA